MASQASLKFWVRGLGLGSRLLSFGLAVQGFGNFGVLGVVTSGSGLQFGGLQTAT